MFNVKILSKEEFLIKRKWLYVLWVPVDTWRSGEHWWMTNEALSECRMKMKFGWVYTTFTDNGWRLLLSKPQNVVWISGKRHFIRLFLCLRWFVLYENEIGSLSYSIYDWMRTDMKRLKRKCRMKNPLKGFHTTLSYYWIIVTPISCCLSFQT